MNQLWQRIRPYLSVTVRFFRISYVEAKSDYQGTRLGILWIPLSTLVFTGLLGLVFRSAGSMSEVEFFLYVLTGYVCWNFIQDSISASTNIIQTKLDFAVHSNLSLVGLFAKTLTDRLFEYGLNMGLLLIAVLIFSPGSFGLNILLYIPLLAMLCATSLAVSYLVNLTTLFYPDLANVIKTAVRFLFFATPIFWSTSSKAGIRLLLERYNPAAYYLKMTRQVFGVESINWGVWGVGLAITAIVCLIGLYSYRSSSQFVRNIK